ncbi:hypothetical protein OFN08_01380 [Acinetobacter baumannii]|uniref:hypothetical protein n=1 Tax=Acinetobacter baumannii TaxID=470 RepID=UPI0010578DB7|nr:hypothetical protein [Acinetobacter baumannii]MDC4705743.1 hypothetical protein [Acinetobacter baumannii]MDC4854767.1 hypothetical protein [Acinetobacter baumannii]MDC4956566.1 hypothetical protein [Acinetobacter baumannii]MDC5422421.1 hypothetical protein [Acinetobacter baumannii]MDC5623092.1 hypothetical protein [Acinetobacter baumannii]
MIHYFNSYKRIISNTLEYLNIQNERILANENSSKEIEKRINRENGLIGRKINELAYVLFSFTDGYKSLNITNFENIEPTKVFKIDSDNPIERFGILYLYSILKNMCMVYFYNNKYKKAHAFSLTEIEYFLCDNAICPNYMEDLKTADDITSMLEKFMPNHIILSKIFYGNLNEPAKEFVSGFGIILFNEEGELLSKANFKFYDLSNAPQNALILDNAQIGASLTHPSTDNLPFLLPQDI